MLLQLNRLAPPAILVAAAVLGSCGEWQPSPGDEDRLQRDGGELDTDEKPAVAAGASPAAAPARPVGLPQSGRPAPGLSLPSVEAKDDGFGDRVRPLMPAQAKRALRD